jgi:hypothetical protein
MDIYKGKTFGKYKREKKQYTLYSIRGKKNEIWLLDTMLI